MQSSQNLATITRGWFESVRNADPGWAERYVSHHAQARLIGTDPGELLTGTAVANFLRNEATSLEGRAQVDPGEVEAFEEGEVGWVFAQPVVSFAGGPPVRPRWTAVFHREEGEWKLVQLHASVAMDNAEVGFADHD